MQRNCLCLFAAVMVTVSVTGNEDIQWVCKTPVCVTVGGKDDMAGEKKNGAFVRTITKNGGDVRSETIETTTLLQTCDEAFIVEGIE